MNKRFIAGCLMVIGAAVLGNWIWSDSTPTEKKSAAPQAIAVATIPSSEELDGLIRSHEIVEVIDLARVFEPTGDEYALQTLLAGLETEDPLPQPRIVTPPNDATSPPSSYRFVRQQAIQFFSRICVEWLNQCLPLQGVDLPTRDANRLLDFGGLYPLSDNTADVRPNALRK